MMPRTMPRTPRHRLRSASTRAVASGLCALLASATMATSVPAAAGPLHAVDSPSFGLSPTGLSTTPSTFLRLAPDEAPASVLGLDGGDANVNAKLTAALRKAFANRGLSGGEEISLEEMRLTMGCANDEVACLAEGGKTLGVRRLVFGYLRPGSGGGVELDIQILDVTSGQLEAQTSVAISKAELAPSKIDAKATAIVSKLMPANSSESDLPPRPDPLPETDIEPEPELEEPEKEKKPRDGALYWGLEDPTPRWKWAAFGTSLGVTVAMAGLTIGTGVWITAADKARFGFRQRLLAAAESSLREDDPFNRVDPEMSGDLCGYNSTDDDGNPLSAGVRHEGVGRACTLGKDAERNLPIFGAVTAVAGVTTLAFLGVLLIHKRKPVADAMLRHGVRLGVAPQLDGQRGLSLSGGLRF